MQFAQPEYMDTFFQYIFGFFDQLFSTPLQPWIPWGPGDWYFTISTTFFVVMILFLVRRLRKSGSGSIADGVRRIIASTGDVSAGMAGAKKVDFISKDPSDALVFLKIEENAIQQALTAADYFAEKGEISDSIKLKLAALYQHRLEVVRQAISSDEQLKSIVATSDEIGKARSDYLRKLAAMSGTAVEAEADAGPPSVGMPTAVPAEAAPPAQAPAAAPPSAGPPSGPPAGGPPSGGPPSGGPPSGGPPAGGPPGGAAPAAGPPSGAAPAAGPPGGAAPAAAPPSGAAPTATPPGGAAPGGAPPGGAAPSADAPAAGGKSSLQSEMLREMERLKALMGGD
ncbi:MAG: hypothetical protein ACFFFC_16330 [Candidatus Thorarchaeota archaeon]